MLTNPNVGGVGQSEVLLVLQSRARLGYYVQVVAATAATQLALVLKKKQYERFRLGQDSRGALHFYHGIQPERLQLQPVGGRITRPGGEHVGRCPQPR